MTANEVGTKLVELFNVGDYGTIYSTLYSPDIVSIEAGDDSKEYVGMAAIEGKNEWWESAFETHGSKAVGPFPNGNDFALYIEMDVTDKASGHRFTMQEVGLYTVADGKIVREKFYYTM